MSKHIVSFALLLPFLGLGGCKTVECAEGSVQEGDRCVAEVVCSEGTGLNNGRCTKNGEDVGWCGGALSTSTKIDENGVCQPIGGSTANAARYATMNLTLPPNLANVANNIINPDLAAKNSLIYVGVYQFGSTLRVWGGIDPDKADGRGSLVAATAFDVAATRGGDGKITTETFDIPMQLLGADTMVLDAQITAGEIDETQPFTMLTKFIFTGVLTPENAHKIIEPNLNEPLDKILKERITEVPDVDVDGDGTDESWTLSGEVMTEPAPVSPR